MMKGAYQESSGIRNSYKTEVKLKSHIKDRRGFRTAGIYIKT